MLNAALEKIFKREKYIKYRFSINDNLHKANKNGYYLSSNFIDQFDIDYLYETLNNWENCDKDEFNRNLKSIISESYDEIKHDVITSIPDRAVILNNIFQLYLAGEYSAMITLSLSQVDGIMKDITDSEGFYSTARGKPRYLNSEIYVKFMSSSDQLHVEERNDYELLSQNCSDHLKFNRHAILHGESVLFGHELNAIKSILLLEFISEIHDANLPL